AGRCDGDLPCRGLGPAGLCHAGAGLDDPDLAGALRHRQPGDGAGDARQRHGAGDLGLVRAAAGAGDAGRRGAVRRAADRPAMGRHRAWHGGGGDDRLADGEGGMKQAVPVLTVLLALIALWYAASVWMNSTWVYDQAARAGESPTLMQVIPQTMAQDRPLLPPPHQVAARLWEGLAGQAVTSKRSLVYHGFVTFRGTMAGFALGIVLGVGLAMAIVRFRVMDMSVMPWAIISQTIPIVAIAPMILVVSN